MAILPVSAFWTHTNIQTLADTHSLNVSDMSRYSSSDYLGNYDMECPQGVFIPTYAPTPTLPPVQPGEPGEPGLPGPPVSIEHSTMSTRTPVSIKHSTRSTRTSCKY